MSNKPRSRKEDIVVQELDGEVLIYDLKKNKVFCLNETSALVWQMCDGEKSVAEISQGLSKKLNQPANEDLVWLAIDQLKKEKLIANGEELVSNLKGLNRREVIKRVGLASMVALPIVAGMIAPSALHAQSGVCGANLGMNCVCMDATITTGTCGSNDCQTGMTGCVCNITAPGNGTTVPSTGVCANP